MNKITEILREEINRQSDSELGELISFLAGKSDSIATFAFKLKTAIGQVQLFSLLEKDTMPQLYKEILCTALDEVDWTAIAVDVNDDWGLELEE